MLGNDVLGIINRGGDEDRKIFNAYPIYLKHTIYPTDEKIGKVRNLEISQRFFCFDNFKEEANGCFRKKKFQDAIGLYEYALSCIKWLEYKPQKDEKEMFPEMEEEYRHFLAVHNDKNVILHNGEKLKDKHEIDMRNSMLIQVYLNLAVTYLKWGHYSLAQIALNDAEKVTHSNSQILYRRSQVITSNLASSLKDLGNAKAHIEEAIKLRPYEKIFQAGRGILAMLNLHNAEEAYVA